MKKNAKPTAPTYNYTVICETHPSLDCKDYHLGEQVRAAFAGIANELYDHIHIEHPNHSEYILIKLVDNVDYAFLDGFEFLSKAEFTHRLKPGHVENWELSVKTDDDFGVGFHVSATTPRKCVLAMISEKRKSLRRQLKSLKKVRGFEDYTHVTHCEC